MSWQSVGLSRSRAPSNSTQRPQPSPTPSSASLHPLLPVSGNMSASSTANGRSPGQPVRSTSITEPCCVCEKQVRTYSCVQCNNDAFCADCWSQERPHRPGAVGMDGLPHEKTDKEVVDRYRGILEPVRTPEQQQNLHKNDEDTTWFGIARDSANLPIFQDYGRYATILAESKAAEKTIRYPQLVSFIGQTNAGKSTLIKMLVDKEASMTNGYETDMSFPTPVTGAINDNIPTSGDVHLYSDPATYWSSRPMLYADCEGLEGGENVPHGARFKQKDGVAPPSSRTSSSTNDPHFRKKMRKAAHSSQRDIAWATTPDKQKREYAVTQLYPRLLYTFSDCVVFVLRNSKVFESVVLEKLLDWASASIEKSLNQPTLPHAIIVLNASEIVPNTNQWEVEEATNTLMFDVAGAIHRTPRFREYANIWRERGRTIQSTKDLLLCFYSSIRVVRIPIKGRYMLMDDQVAKLRVEIQRCCKDSYDTKRQVRMLSNAEKLQIYLQSAFDHFSQNLDTPFDFVKEAIKINPIPRDFRGNILKLALAIRDQSSFKYKHDGPRIFQELSHMVASCVMLDAVRQGLLGTALQLFEEYYLDPCEEALDNFCDTYWTCAFSNRYGECILMKSGHSLKGHQNANGRIIAAGNFESNFEADDYADTWVENLRRKLEEIQRKLQRLMLEQPQIVEQDAASKLHRHQMNDFYLNIGQATDFISHSTCFSCLRELPEHPLPCGHVLCTPCVRSYGTFLDKTVIQIPSCPLHSHDCSWQRPWRIKIKPKHAGVRVLSLDGGGARGIVELEVLKAIERKLGRNLPIQAFFDLIVGTSTGGIIALGLGAENWSVDTCIQKFVNLCGEAFTPRVGKNVWGVGHIMAAIHGSKYKTKPFEAALKEAFGAEKILFNGEDDIDGFKTKVAVTSTTNIESQPLILTNYNRPDPPGYASYRFERFDYPSKEMKTWEAARATSAAPPYFKPFVKAGTKASYLDGALYHNNPVNVAHHEHRLIWSDVSAAQPDILLSVGTGHFGPTDRATSHLSTTRRVFSPMLGLGEQNSPFSEAGPTRKHIPNFTEQLWNTVASRVDHILNCNRIWEAFRAEILEPYTTSRRRYVRINPDLDFKVPSLDEYHQIPQMQKSVQRKMKNDPRITEVAHRLIASTFFFEKTMVDCNEIENRFQCKGVICCRFSTSGEYMRDLGNFLMNYLTPSFTPYFMVSEPKLNDISTWKKVPISERCINKMCLRGIFDMGTINIMASRQLSETMIALCLQEAPYRFSNDSELPISGFPRALMAEDSMARTTSRALVTRDSGSFRRPHRRRRHGKATASGDSSPPEPSSLRRVKSQSNLKAVELSGDYEQYPNNLEDVRKRAKVHRSRSVDSTKAFEARAETSLSLGRSSVVSYMAAEQRPSMLFELADTSTTNAASEYLYEPLSPAPKRGRNLRHLVA